MVMDVSQIPTELIEQENQRRIKNNVMQAVMPLFDFQNRMKEVHPGITNDAINGISQGLNNGYKDIDEYQTLANIRKPQNQEEIDLAKQGQFNLPEQNNQAMVSNILGKVKGGLSDVAAGYRDNTMNGFNFGNLQSDPNKSGWQRLGEALGTGQRFLGNPALQGLIAGAIYGKQRGDFGEGLKYGIDWAQNKATQNYYADVMGQPRKILGGYTANDYKAQVDAKRKDFQNQIEQKKYEVYAANILDQIDMRDKNFKEKVREFALKFGLDERKLAQQIKYQSGMLALGKERNAISRENNKARNERLANNDSIKLITTNIKNLNDLEKAQGSLSEDQAKARDYYMSLLQDLAEQDEWELVEE